MNPKNRYNRIQISMISGGLLLIGLLMFLNGPLQTVRAAPSDLFVSLGGSGDCSQSAPCDLQTALGSANGGDTIYLAQGRYTGSGTAVISLTQSITLYGGWDGMEAAPPVHDPRTYPVTLDGENQRRVIFVSSNITPTIDGFIVTGGNATGLGGGLFSSDAGGGVYSLDASPIIQNNIITDNLASTQAGSRAEGGGIYIKGSSPVSATVRYNQILSNTAGIGIHLGEGGGIFINGPGTIQDNVLKDNNACQSCSQAYGGGIRVGWTTDYPLIVDNLIKNNQAETGGGMAFAWSAVRVSGNIIVSNTAVWGAGLYTHYDEGSTISANTVMSNTASSSGGGLTVRITIASEEPTYLTNNVIAHNHAVDGGGIHAYSDWHLAAITMTHNTLADNGEGVVVGDHMTATLINNIVADQAMGITLTNASGVIHANYTLFWGNTDDGIRGDNPVDGNPTFADSANGDYHIGFDSAAKDAGMNAGAAADRDGMLRNAIPDIGAYEWQARIYLPIVIKG